MAGNADFKAQKGALDPDRLDGGNKGAVAPELWHGPATAMVDKISDASDKGTAAGGADKAPAFDAPKAFADAGAGGADKAPAFDAPKAFADAGAAGFEGAVKGLDASFSFGDAPGHAAPFALAAPSAFADATASFADGGVAFAAFGGGFGFALAPDFTPLDWGGAQVV